MSSNGAQPSVCVVICNFNKADDLVVAIESVLASTGVTVEVIVVDNCSTDDSVEAVRSLGYSQVEVVVLEANIGGSGGFKAGMDLATKRSAEFILLLDNDASVANDTLSGLVDALRVDSELGAVGPAILKAYSPAQIQDVGGFLSTEYYSHWPGFNSLPYAAVPKTPLYCEYLASCCLLTRRSTLQQVGSFDPGYFLYWDDVDWCTRLREAGFRLKVIPELRAWHKGGIQTATGTNPTYFNIRNRVQFFRRIPQLWGFKSALSGIELNLREVIFGSLVKEDSNYIEANLAGFRDGLQGVFNQPPPASLKTRKPVGSSELILNYGGTYRLRFDGWFYSDTFEIKRLNPSLTHGDYHRIARVVATVSGLKNRYGIRAVLEPEFFDTLDSVERRILEDLVEVHALPVTFPTLRITRHISDLVAVDADDQAVTDPFLNSLPKSQSVSDVRSHAGRLVSEVLALSSSYRGSSY